MAALDLPGLTVNRSFVAEAITPRPDAAFYFSAAAGRLKGERFIDVREGLPFPRITKWM